MDRDVYTGRRHQSHKTPLVNARRGQANYVEQGGGFCNANGKRRTDGRNGITRLQARKVRCKRRDLMNDKRTSNYCNSECDDSQPTSEQQRLSRGRGSCVDGIDQYYVWRIVMS